MGNMHITRVNPDAQGQVNWPDLGQERKNAVTVGNFDGVHLGHQRVIRRTIEEAAARGGRSVAILFDPRPALVHAYLAEHPDAAADMAAADFTLADPDELTSINQRLALLDSLGLDEAIVVHYTPAFAEQTYMYFLGALAGKLGMSALVLGKDARMGKGMQGTRQSIDRLAQATRMFELIVVNDEGPGFVHIPAGQVADAKGQLVPVERQVRVWSSSNVRHLLETGQLDQANVILGRHHVMVGTVVHGEQRGRVLGYPTANLGRRIEGFMPSDGVYAGYLIDCGPATDQIADQAETAAEAGSAAVDGQLPVSAGQSAAIGETGESVRCYPAAISVGTKLTFEDEIGVQQRLVESNALLDGQDWIDLYGHQVRVEFISHLRDQMKFDSVDALVCQMEKDVAATRLAAQAD